MFKFTQQNIIKPQINKWGGDQIHNPNTIRGQGRPKYREYS